MARLVASRQTEAFLQAALSNAHVPLQRAKSILPGDRTRTYHVVSESFPHTLSSMSYLSSKGGQNARERASSYKKQARYLPKQQLFSTKDHSPPSTSLLVDGTRILSLAKVQEYVDNIHKNGNLSSSEKDVQLIQMLLWILGTSDRSLNDVKRDERMWKSNIYSTAVPLQSWEKRQGSRTDPESYAYTLKSIDCLVADVLEKETFREGVHAQGCGLLEKMASTALKSGAYRTIDWIAALCERELRTSKVKGGESEQGEGSVQEKRSNEILERTVYTCLSGYSQRGEWGKIWPLHQLVYPLLQRTKWSNDAKEQKVCHILQTILLKSAIKTPSSSSTSAPMQQKVHNQLELFRRLETLAADFESIKVQPDQTWIRLYFQAVEKGIQACQYFQGDLAKLRGGVIPSIRRVRSLFFNQSGGLPGQHDFTTFCGILDVELEIAMLLQKLDNHQDAKQEASLSHVASIAEMLADTGDRLQGKEHLDASQAVRADSHETLHELWVSMKSSKTLIKAHVAHHQELKIPQELSYICRRLEESQSLMMRDILDTDKKALQLTQQIFSTVRATFIYASRGLRPKTWFDPSNADVRQCILSVLAAIKRSTAVGIWDPLLVSEKVYQPQTPSEQPPQALVRLFHSTMAILSPCDRIEIKAGKKETKLSLRKDSTLALDYYKGLGILASLHRDVMKRAQDLADSRHTLQWRSTFKHFFQKDERRVLRMVSGLATVQRGGDLNHVDEIVIEQVLTLVLHDIVLTLGLASRIWESVHRFYFRHIRHEILSKAARKKSATYFLAMRNNAIQRNYTAILPPPPIQYDQTKLDKLVAVSTDSIHVSPPSLHGMPPLAA